MTLSDLAAIGSLISSIAVLISLIYLALQVRQAEKNQQASIRQGRATRAVDIILAAGEPSLAAALPKGSAGADDITQAEFGQFTAIYGAFLASAEDTYLQYKEGLLSEAVFASFGASWRQALAQPGVRALWTLRRFAFEAGFAAFMDKLGAPNRAVRRPRALEGRSGEAARRRVALTAPRRLQPVAVSNVDPLAEKIA